MVSRLRASDRTADGGGRRSAARLRARRGRPRSRRKIARPTPGGCRSGRRARMQRRRARPPPRPGYEAALLISAPPKTARAEERGDLGADLEAMVLKPPRGGGRTLLAGSVTLAALGVFGIISWYGALAAGGVRGAAVAARPGRRLGAARPPRPRGHSTGPGGRASGYSAGDCHEADSHGADRSSALRRRHHEDAAGTADGLRGLAGPQRAGDTCRPARRAAGARA